MNSDNFSDLGHEFDAAFIYPIASHRWSTKRGRSHWLDLEGWRSSLAGPIWSIVKKGGCAYVYDRDDEFFAGVNEPAALRARLRQWHDKLVVGLERFQATSPAEETDVASMQQFARAMWAVAERACDIEQSRWEAARHTNGQL